MTPDQTATATRILCEHLGREPSELTDSARFYEDLNADSLDAVELTMAFEEAFGIEIDEDEIPKTWMMTVGDVFALLGRKL